MSYGLRTKSAGGAVISEFDGDFLRFVLRVRVNALATGSLQLPISGSKARFFFQPDEPVQTTPPVIDITSGGLLTWRPYATSPSYHTGGYILIGLAS